MLNNRSVPGWVKNNMKLGAFGEKIAEEYLSQFYPNIERVSMKDDSLGYDLEADENKFEVKTSENNGVAFYISINQLKTANRLTDKYNLFYINIDNAKQLITGFIINDPIKILNLNNFNINYSENSNVNIMPSVFTISLNESFIQKNCKWLTLNNYMPKQCNVIAE
jgi:hypothetical protein